MRRWRGEPGLGSHTPSARQTPNLFLELKVVMQRNRFLALGALIVLAAGSRQVFATPYASQVTISGTQVSFVLNEAAASLTYSVNGAASVALAPTKGLHTFPLNSPTDTFSIVADKTENGFTQLDGNKVAATANALPAASPEAYYTPISDDANSFLHFVRANGVAVSTDPNAPNFGAIYIASASAGTPSGTTRTVGKGLYVINADQTDATANGGYGVGYGNTAQQVSFFSTSSVNSPNRMFVDSDGYLYVAGLSDITSGVFRAAPNLTTSFANLFPGNQATGPPPALPAGQYHGSVYKAVVSGSVSGGNLVVYTLDEDMNTGQLNDTTETTDTNQLWRYDINGAALPFAGKPAKVLAAPLLLPNVTVGGGDLAVGNDGKFYLSQTRTAGTDTSGLFVTDSNGNAIYKSLPRSLTTLGDYNQNFTADAGDYVLWRKTLGNTGAALQAVATDGDGDGTVNVADYAVWRANFGSATADLLRQSTGFAVSPDQDWLASLNLNNSITLIPLVNGIPDLANRQVINVPNTTVQGRDIVFDAAGNLYYASSGQQQIRVLAPGGHTVATTTWNGTSYSFNVSTFPGSGSSFDSGAAPEPATIGLLMVAGLVGVLIRRGGKGGMKVEVVSQ